MLSRADKLRAVREAHEAWVAENLATVSFSPPEGLTPGSVFNQHFVDLDASGEAQDAYAATVAAIFHPPIERNSLAAYARGIEDLLVRAAKTEHWPAGTPGGKGGQFKPKAASAVRQALHDAKTIPAISRAIAAEIKRVSGNDTSVNLRGADPQVAREIGEGILRGLEHTPSTRLTSLKTYGEGGTRRARLHEGGEYGNANNAKGDGVRTTEIAFNTKWVSDPESFRASLKADAKRDYGVRGNIGGEHGPMGIAVHEFGHVAASQVPATHERHVYHTDGRVLNTFIVGVEWEALDHAQGLLKQLTGSEYGNSKMGYRDFVGKQISGYASWERGEFVAEAFADVVLNKDKASQLSRDVYAMVVRGAS